MRPEGPSVYKRIVLFGTYAEENTGDDYMLVSQILGIRNRYPDSRLTIFTGDCERTRTLLSREKISEQDIDIVYSGRKGLAEPDVISPRCFFWMYNNVRAIAQADLLVIGPGNQIQDVTRRFRVLFFLARAVLAWMFKTPYAFMGIGYYELRSRFCRWMFRFTANRASFVSTRDVGGAERIVAEGITETRVVALRDITFSYEWPRLEDRQKGNGRPLIGLTHRVFLEEVFPEDTSKSMNVALVALLRHIKETLDARFVFFRFYKGSQWNDSVALERLRQQPGEAFPLVEGVVEPLAKLQENIAGCDALIGVRYHSVLMAVQSAVPVLGISYAHKTERFMSDVGLERYGCRVEDATADVLKAKWADLWENRDAVRGELQAIVQHDKQTANHHFDLMFQAMGE